MESHNDRRYPPGTLSKILKTVFNAQHYLLPRDTNFALLIAITPPKERVSVLDPNSPPDPFTKNTPNPSFDFLLTNLLGIIDKPPDQKQKRTPQLRDFYFSYQDYRMLVKALKLSPPRKREKQRSKTDLSPISRVNATVLKKIVSLSNPSVNFDRLDQFFRSIPLTAFFHFIQDGVVPLSSLIGASNLLSANIERSFDALPIKESMIPLGIGVLGLMSLKFVQDIYNLTHNKPMVTILTPFLHGLLDVDYLKSAMIGRLSALIFMVTGMMIESNGIHHSAGESLLASQVFVYLSALFFDQFLAKKSSLKI